VVRDDILAYYQRGGERERLSRGAGRLEFLRTWDVLTRVLPSAPAQVLDVGGGMGVYAVPLAAAGYEVHLVDPVPSHVAQASEAGVTASVGDARALSQADASADAVLLLGPLYHLVDRDERVRAWREAARVVRPGGVVVAATISRFASLFDGFVKGFYADPLFRPLVEGALADGRHRNPSPDRTYFTTAYFHHPSELAAEPREAGLDVERVVAVESPLWMVDDQRLDAILADVDLLLEMLRRIEEEPGMLAASSHQLTIARRPQ
jgi:ubiquinone/menaquinone biosynthesis C-methylase UbiE